MKPRHEQALVLVSVLATLLLLEVIAKGYLLHFASYQNFIKFAPPSMLEKNAQYREGRLAYKFTPFVTSDIFPPRIMNRIKTNIMNGAFAGLTLHILTTTL